MKKVMQLCCLNFKKTSKMNQPLVASEWKEKVHCITGQPGVWRDVILASSVSTCYRLCSRKKMCHFSWKWEWSAHLHNMAWLYCWQSKSKGVQSLGHVSLPGFFAQHGFFASCCCCPGHMMRKAWQAFSLRGLKREGCGQMGRRAIV